MTSNARRKIDNFTQQMFDLEVDTPTHDQVLTNLFNDLAAQAQILTDFHQLEPLLPIEKYGSFRVHDAAIGWRREEVAYAEACDRCGPFPNWESTSPLRLVGKELECLMDYTPSGGAAARLMGFMDIAVLYDILLKPTVHIEEGKWFWNRNARRHLALIEVKGKWPTAGNLIRQLNLYRSCWTRNFRRYVAFENHAGYHERAFFVAGPDDSMNALVNEHGYRLVTFDKTATSFKLQPKVSQSAVSTSPKPF